VFSTLGTVGVVGSLGDFAVGASCGNGISISLLIVGLTCFVVGFDVVGSGGGRGVGSFGSVSLPLSLCSAFF
jgi:hypothetical protein